MLLAVTRQAAFRHIITLGVRERPGGPAWHDRRARLQRPGLVCRRGPRRGGELLAELLELRNLAGQEFLEDHA